MELRTDLTTPVVRVAAERSDDDGEATAVGRRGFLKLGVGAAAGLAACQRLPVRHAMPYLVPPEEVTPGVPVHYASTCTACPAACGLVMTVRDGRPVKLEGRPEHVLSRGGLCAVGQADLRGLYDSGRLQRPSLHGKPVTWDDLDGYVRTRLEEVRRDGQEVWILAPTLVSPTARAAVGELLSRYAGRLVEHDPGPGSPSAWLEAWEALTGRALAPALELEAADLLVTLGADLLGAGPEPVAHTTAYAARRRAGGRPAFRHVHVEGTLSLTGAAADERWPATATERRLVALGLLRRLAEATPGGEAAAIREALGASVPLGAFEERVARLAAALAAHRGHGLLVCGDEDRAEALAVAVCNRLLGSEGATLDVARPSLVRRGLDRDLAGLLEAQAAGRVGALVVVGLDPVDQLPDGAGWEAMLRRLPLSVAITERPTATASACAAVVASHHGLESWGDFVPRPGVLTLGQPAVRPLFDTRPPFESFLRWAGVPTTDYRLYLVARWRREVLGDGPGFEAAWTRAVADGLAPEDAARSAGALAPARTALGGAAALGAALEKPAPLADGATLEVELLAEVALRDGSRAHVPWLRELPDPLTRVAWSPCVRVAPETARTSGLRDGDVVTVRVGERAAEMPVRVLPGQHPCVLGLPIGYGRADGDPGRPERNAVRLARLENGCVVTRGLGATIVRTARTEPLPLVQTHSATEGRPVVFQVAARDERVHGSHEPEGRDLWPETKKPAPQWHMVLDLDACTGCSACVVACQAENNVAVVGPDEVLRHRDMHWLRIDRYFVGGPEEPDVLFEPMLCAQCGHAPCETVCPVAATVHSEDGLNQQVYNRCVGTRYCANNCPYKARRFNWFDNDEKRPLERMVLNPDVVVRARGVMEKCTFCVQRIQAARIAARAEGGPDVPAVQTACQQTCPAHAITFGDATDPDGPVSRLRREARAFQVLPDLGIEPGVTYLARVRNRGATGHEGPRTRGHGDPA